MSVNESETHSLRHSTRIWIAPLGPQVDAFEAEMAKTRRSGNAVALSSGTAGLHLALVLLGVGPDDEVLVPSFTFAATANAVVYVGAEPVLVDSDWSTWTIDPAHHRRVA